jgi:agmatinase
MKSRVAVMGVPWDEQSSFLKGCAAAPDLIRRAFLSPGTNTCAENGRELGREEQFRFLGNMTLGSGTPVLGEIEAQANDLISGGDLPIFLGGDHAVTYPLVKAVATRYGRINILHFDAHPDLYDHLEGERHSHACPFARLWEEGLIQRHVAVGIRTSNPHQKKQAEKFGSEILEMRRFPWEPFPAFRGPVYLSLDLDVLDPAFAPGVSHHEPGGMSARDLIGMIQGLQAELIGADIVEYNPDRDLNGLTAMVAAKLLKEIAVKLFSD